MIAIVHQNDIARLHERKALDHALGRLRLPVIAKPRPHHHAGEAEGAHHAIHLRSAKTKRRPHVFHGTLARLAANRLRGRFHRAERLLHGVFALPQFAANARAREKNHVRMRFGVVGKQMAARGDFANEIGTSLNKAAHQKKGGTRLVAVEQLEQIRRNARIGAVVEGQCNLASRATIGQMMNRLAEELRGRRDGCPATRTNCRQQRLAAHLWTTDSNRILFPACTY